jgi:hypothetical protein
MHERQGIFTRTELKLKLKLWFATKLSVDSLGAPPKAFPALRLPWFPCSHVTVIQLMILIIHGGNSGNQ